MNLRILYTTKPWNWEYCIQLYLEPENTVYNNTLNLRILYTTIPWTWEYCIQLYNEPENTVCNYILDLIILYTTIYTEPILYRTTYLEPEHTGLQPCTEPILYKLNLYCIELHISWSWEYCIQLYTKQYTVLTMYIINLRINFPLDQNFYHAHA